MKDYVLAKNEKEFITLAENMGFTELVFIGGGNINELKSKIKVSSSRRVFRSDIKKDRGLIEGRKADIIFGFEALSRKDGFHFLNSGMNQVIAKLMNDKNVAYGISFSQLLAASRQEQVVILGRIMQNIKLCKKYKVRIIVGSFASFPYQMRDPRDLLAFARTLGLYGYKP